MRVFISHSHEDAWTARKIAEDLERRGVGSFLAEKDLRTGDPIDEMVIRNLETCDHLLVILSPASVRSSWVLLEMGMGLVLRKRLVPILLHLGPDAVPEPVLQRLARGINEIERYYHELEQHSESAAPSKPISEQTTDIHRVSANQPKAVNPLWLEAYEELHSSFFSADLEEDEILEILGRSISRILSDHKKWLIQFLYRQDAGLSGSTPSEKGLGLDQLFIRWSSKHEEIGTVVPMDSVSGRLLLSGKREILVNPTEEWVREFYRDFSDFETRTEFAVVIQTPEASSGIGVLNIELPTAPSVLLPKQRQEIRDLVEMVAPLMSAVRRRNAMASSRRKAYVHAVNDYLSRITALFAHKFGRLVVLRIYLDLLKEASQASDWRPDPKLIDNIKEEAQWFEEALNSLWEAISNVAEIGPIRVVDILAEIAREEASLAEEYLEWDPQQLSALPPIRASRLLKEHLINICENAADSIRDKQWRLGQAFKGIIKIEGEEITRLQSHSDGQHDILRDLNRRIRITILDNGEGIKPEHIGRVFEPGFSTKDTGSGFSLPAVREYMRELLGSLRLESEPGQYCKIVLEIPIYDVEKSDASS